MGVEGRGQGLMRGFGSSRYQEAREDQPISEQAMDADGQAMEGLWCGVCGRFGAVRAKGSAAVYSVSHYVVTVSVGAR